MRGLALRAVGAYVGSVIGAGFASGQEVLFFFARFGYPGLWGCLLATALFAWLGYRTAALAGEAAVGQYREFFALVAGRCLGALMDALATSFLLMGLCVVLAGVGALGAEQWGAPYLLGVGLAAVVLALAGRSGPAGLLLLNGYLVVPLLGCLLLLLAADVARLGLARPVPAAGAAPGSWWFSAVGYVSYNWLVAAPCLSALGRELAGERRAGRYGALGGLLIGAALAAVTSALWIHAPDVYRFQLPLARVAEVHGPAWKAVYALGLLAALATTGLAILAGLQGRLRHRAAAPLALLLALALAGAGFAPLVRTMYSLYGLAGLPLMLACLSARRRKAA